MYFILLFSEQLDWGILGHLITQRWNYTSSETLFSHTFSISGVQNINNINYRDI